MKLIAGLGNPGRRYEHTRHNVGWWVLDHLADVWRCTSWESVGDSLVCDGALENMSVRLIKPQTFMNLSGQAIAPYLNSEGGLEGIDPRADLLVIVDDVAIPVGRYRIRPQGSSGGHNGLNDLERTFGHQHYARLRLGVGPTVPETRIPDMADYVLSDVPADEKVVIDALLPTCEGACRTWLLDGVSAAMNRFNGGAVPKPRSDEEPPTLDQQVRSDAEGPAN